MATIDTSQIKDPSKVTSKEGLGNEKFQDDADFQMLEMVRTKGGNSTGMIMDIVDDNARERLPKKTRQQVKLGDSTPKFPYSNLR